MSGARYHGTWLEMVTNSSESASGFLFSSQCSFAIPISIRERQERVTSVAD